MLTSALELSASRDAGSDDRPAARRARSGAGHPVEWKVTAESHVMRRIRDGDLEAFELLYRTYFVSLWEFAYRYLHDTDAAQDVVQDVLVALWDRREALTGHERIPPYLYAAVRYRALDAVRHIDTARRARTVIGAAELAVTASADAELVEAEANAAVERALAQLSDGPRRVLLLRWKHGLSFAEIAESLGISENAAKVQASRGRQALAPYLRDLLTPE
jgi:RNA polymerase sigma-70 factor (ECF subfamily)